MHSKAQRHPLLATLIVTYSKREWLAEELRSRLLQLEGTEEDIFVLSDSGRNLRAKHSVVLEGASWRDVVLNGLRAIEPLGYKWVLILMDDLFPTECIDFARIRQEVSVASDRSLSMVLFPSVVSL